MDGNLFCKDAEMLVRSAGIKAFTSPSYTLGESSSKYDDHAVVHQSSVPTVHHVALNTNNMEASGVDCWAAKMPISLYLLLT